MRNEALTSVTAIQTATLLGIIQQLIFILLLF